MTLNEEQFSLALAALGCGENSAGAEQRARTRVPMGTRATIIVFANDQWRDPDVVMVMNVSEMGIGLLGPTAMKPGDKFILRLPAANNQAASGILCTVARSQPFATGMYVNGAQYTQVLSPRVMATNNSGAVFQNVDEAGEQDLSHLRLVEEQLSRLNLHVSI